MDRMGTKQFRPLRMIGRKQDGAIHHMIGKKHKPASRRTPVFANDKPSAPRVRPAVISNTPHY